MDREPITDNVKADNREIQRFSIAVPACVEPTPGSASNSSIELFSRDVCSAGAFFLTSHPLDVGTRVVVRLLLRPPHMVSLKGKKAQVTISGDVLRTDKEGMAVRFDRNYLISSISQ